MLMPAVAPSLDGIDPAGPIAEDRHGRECKTCEKKRPEGLTVFEQADRQSERNQTHTDAPDNQGQCAPPFSGRAPFQREFLGIHRAVAGRLCVTKPVFSAMKT